VLRCQPPADLRSTSLTTRSPAADRRPLSATPCRAVS